MASSSSTIVSGTTSSSSNINTSTNSGTSGSTAGKDIKSIFAGIHGAGEALRGSVNSAVDETFSGRKNAAESAEGIVRNENVAEGGVAEMESGEFNRGTKVREGVAPGDGGRRL